MLFENILGSEKVFGQLKRLSAKPLFPPLLFWGRPGIGKRTTALLFTQNLMCEKEGCGECRFCQEIAQMRHPDLWVLFPSPPQPKRNDDERYLDTIQRLRRGYSLNQKRPTVPKNYVIHLEDIHNLSTEMRFKPRLAKKRVVIVIDTERMTQEASNAFLKTLEEPQRDTVFILLTSRFSFLPSTIRSRCLPIYFPPLKDEIITEYLLKMGYDEISVKRALAFAYGSLRRALDFLSNPFPIPEEILSLALSPSLPTLFTLIDELRLTNWEETVQNLILLFHSQLLKKTGLKNYETFYPEGFTVEELLTRIESLLNLQPDLAYNLNRRLFLFSFLTMLLKKSGRKQTKKE